MASRENINGMSFDLGDNLITWLFLKSRIRVQNESMGLFAVNLASGIPLLQTIDISRKSMPWKPYRDAMDAMYKGLSEGRSLLDVLQSTACKALPPFVLVVLASDLSDIEKGDLIRLKFSNVDTSQTLIGKAMAYPLTELFISIQTCIALVMFVLPQFHEIFSGMHVPLPSATRLLINISDAIITWWFLIVPVALLFFIFSVVFLQTAHGKRAIRRLLGIQHLDFAETLKILAEIAPDRIERVLQTLSLPLIMPYSSAMSAHFRDAIGSGQPVDSVLVRHGFDAQAAWMIRLALEGKGTRENFSIAADLIEARANGSLKRRIILVEVLSPLLLALFVGFVAISVFLPMITLLEHT